MALLHWDALLGGIKRIIYGDSAPTVELPERRRLRFYGASVADNATDNAIDVTVTAVGAGGLTNVTGTAPIVLSTPGTGVRNVAISATPSFTSVDVTSYVRAGAGAKRFQDAAPSAAGHVSVLESTGRLRAYVNGAAYSVPVFNDIVNAGTYRHIKDAAAGDQISDAIWITSGFAFDLSTCSAFVYPSATVTNHASNYAKIFLYRLFDSSGRTLIASGTTQTGQADTITMTKDEPVALIMASTTLASGFGVQVEILKTGTGVLLPNFRLEYAGKITI